MMKYTVIAFYPDLDIKKRITEYDSKQEAYEYIACLRLLDTPYVLFNQEGKVLDREYYDMKPSEMIDFIQKYC